MVHTFNAYEIFVFLYKYSIKPSRDDPTAIVSSSWFDMGTIKDIWLASVSMFVAVPEFDLVVHSYRLERQMEICRCTFNLCIPHGWIIKCDKVACESIVKEGCTIFVFQFIKTDALAGRIFHHLQMTMILRNWWMPFRGSRMTSQSPCDELLVTHHLFFSLQPHGHLHKFIFAICSTIRILCEVNV